MALTQLTAGLLFGVMWALLGLSIYIGAPFVFGEALPQRIRHKLAKQYWWAAMKARGRTLVTLVGRELSICSCDRDALYGTEVVELDGEPKHVPDPDRRMTTSYRERLGLAITDPAAAVVDQRLTRLAAANKEDVEDDRDAIWTEGDADHPSYWEAFIAIPKRAVGVNLADAVAAFKGQASADVVDRHEEYIRHSLVEQQDDRLIPDDWQTMMIFLATFLLIFVTLHTLGGGGGGGAALGGVMP